MTKDWCAVECFHLDLSLKTREMLQTDSGVGEV